MADPAIDSLNRTPLYALHVSLGAKLVPFAGYEMPVQFPMGILNEHLHTRRAAGLFDFSFMGLYEFEGGVPAQTRDVAALEPGQIAYTLILKPDGAVLIDATVWRLDHARYWLFAGKRAAYGGRERSGEYAVLALQGPASGWILARLIGPDALAGLRYFRFLEKDGLIVARIGYSGELGYELVVPAGQAAALRSRLLQAGQGEGLRECTWAAADSLRIEAGYVLFDREVDGVANPRELGLERLAPGKTFDLRKKLVGLEIFDEAGSASVPAQVTSECFSPTLGRTIALGFAANRGLGILVLDPQGEFGRDRFAANDHRVDFSIKRLLGGLRGKREAQVVSTDDVALEGAEAFTELLRRAGFFESLGFKGANKEREAAERRPDGGRHVLDRRAPERLLDPEHARKRGRARDAGEPHRGSPLSSISTKTTSWVV